MESVPSLMLLDFLDHGWSAMLNVSAETGTIFRWLHSSLWVVVEDDRTVPKDESVSVTPPPLVWVEWDPYHWVCRVYAKFLALCPSTCQTWKFHQELGKVLVINLSFVLGIKHWKWEEWTRSGSGYESGEMAFYPFPGRDCQGWL